MSLLTAKFVKKQSDLGWSALSFKKTSKKKKNNKIKKINK